MDLKMILNQLQFVLKNKNIFAVSILSESNKDYHFTGMDNPELYTENNQLQEFGVERFFNFHGEYLRNEYRGKEITLIDIGSGCGRVLTEVVVGKSGLKFSKIIGIDKSEEMVRFSSEKYGNDLMSFQVMDTEGEIPESLKNQQFDMVTSFFCLPYCKDLNAAFLNIQNFLKPNGLFCCIFSQLSRSNENPEKKLQSMSSAQLTEVKPEAITIHLNKNGMEQIKFINIENDEHEYPNIEAVKRIV